MGHYIANVRDIEFNLLEVLRLGTLLRAGRYRDLDVDTARTDFLRLSASGAQRVLRFWQVRHAVANEPSNPLAQNGLRPLRQPPPSTARTPDDGPSNVRPEQR